MSNDKNLTLNWDEYYVNKSNQIPRETLLKVLEFFDKEKKSAAPLYAIDLGCGHGADTLELLKRGWRVLAIDNNAAGLSLLEESIKPEFKDRLEASKMSFENIKLTECDLVNAGYSLPFCAPEYFPGLWDKIESSVKTGGRFSGNFFGLNDSWANTPRMTFHTKEQVLKFFEKFEFEIEYFDEKDEDGFTSGGDAKHWHVYSVIARKV